MLRRKIPTDLTEATFAGTPLPCALASEVPVAGVPLRLCIASRPAPLQLCLHTPRPGLGALRALAPDAAVRAGASISLVAAVSILLLLSMARALLPLPAVAQAQ